MLDFKLNKKAQVTAFIILGVLILISVGIYSYVRFSETGPDDFFSPKAPPVVAFVDACIERTTVSALTVMGAQGGYISLPPSIAYNPTRYVSLVPGVGGDFAPKVPYWYFDGKTQIPALGYMEHEVEQYINTNLRFCLNGFRQMADEYTVIEKSSYSADVVFTDKDTVVDLSYKLEIRPKGGEEIIQKDQFLVRLDVKVKKMHELAREILEAENEMTFFENMTINLMASHPSDDIPFTGLELQCGKKVWLTSDIKKKLMKALGPSVSAVRFKNTNHPPFKYQNKPEMYEAVHRAVTNWRESEVNIPLQLPKKIPEDSFEYFQYYFQFTDKDYADFKVLSTFKDGWGMNLVATPNEYGVLKSGVQDLKSEIMSFLCINTYHFVYDLTYPVMININDPEALHGAGFVFRYAFPVQVFHNQPDRSLLPTQLVEPVEFASRYCDFFAPEYHTIIVRDVVTNAELSKVNLTFRCLREECPLGTTRTDNRHLQWSGKFPDGCHGPVIVANHSGYFTAEKQFEGSEPFYIDLYPTQELKFDVRRHTESAPTVARYLEPNMYAILQLELVQPRISVPVSVMEVFSGEEGIFQKKDSFEILRGDALYNVNLMLMEKSEGEDKLIGGWIGNWSVALEDVLDAKMVIFHIPQKYPAPTTTEELVDLYELMSNRSRFPEIVPELVRMDEYVAESIE